MKKILNWVTSVLKICCLSIITFVCFQGYLSIRHDINNIYFLMKQQHANVYVIQDTLIRIFHYTKPHKPFEWIAKNDNSGIQIPFCSECIELLKQANLYNEPGQWIEESRLKELENKEKELNYIKKVSK